MSDKDIDINASVEEMLNTMYKLLEQNIKLQAEQAFGCPMDITIQPATRNIIMVLNLDDFEKAHRKA